ncbi:MAG: hypothetical protein IJL25_12095 [Clostridia bacterium]|nr:hypothetical protein [Clostridia bacterium]
MSITERIAYIKGLAEGLDIDKETKEGKLFGAIIEALEDIALEVSDMTERVDMIDCDLADVEDYIDELEESFDDNWDDDWYDDDDEDDGEGYEFECPNCHETVYFDDSIFDDEDFELECPACGAKLDSLFDFEDDDEGDEE